MHTWDQPIWEALDTLAQDFPSLNWDISPDNHSSSQELVSHFLGNENEAVMVCVFKGHHLDEPLHRQDFFFLHFALEGTFHTLSRNENTRIAIQEGDCYIGQPHNAYAVKVDSQEECIIIGILIRRDSFIPDFLAYFASATAMLNFFLEAERNDFADEYVHMSIPIQSLVWRLLGLLILEYAQKTEHSQLILKPLISALCLAISAEYKQQQLPVRMTLADQIVTYLEEHADSATLSTAAQHFGYHPAYISKLLPQETGRTFTQIILDTRMKRANLLLEHTDLSIEKIAALVGYSNNSNFYKAYKSYYGHSPRRTTV